MSEPAPSDAVALKLVIAWAGGAIGQFTLSSAVLTATLIFTIVQTVFTLRDKWWRERPEWRDRYGNPRDRRNLR